MESRRLGKLASPTLFTDTPTDLEAIYLRVLQFGVILKEIQLPESGFTFFG